MKAIVTFETGPGAVRDVDHLGPRPSLGAVGVRACRAGVCPTALSVFASNAAGAREVGGGSRSSWATSSPA